MKNKNKILTITLLLTLILVGISQVSAIEIEDTELNQTTNENIIIDEIQNNEENNSNQEHAHTSLSGIMDSNGVIMKASYYTTTSLSVNASEIFAGENVKLSGSLYNGYTGKYIAKTLKLYLYKDYDGTGYSSLNSFTSSSSITTSSSSPYTGTYDISLVTPNVTYYYYAHFESDGASRPSSDSSVVSIKTYSDWLVELLGNYATDDITISSGQTVKFNTVVHPKSSTTRYLNLNYDYGNVTRYYDTITTASTKTVPLYQNGYYVFTSFWNGDNTHGNATSNPIIVRVNGGGTEDPNFSISAPTEVTQGQILTVTNNLPSDAEGTIIYYLNGVYVGSSNPGSNFIFNVDKAGNNVITAKYSGDEKYDIDSFSFNFIADAIADLSFSKPNYGVVGESFTISTILPSDATGDITYFVDGVEVKTLNIGESFTYTPTSYGLKNITAQYNGNSFYKPANYTTTLRVKTTPTISIIPNKYGIVNEKLYVEINLPEDATGNVTWYYGSTSYSNVNFNLSNGSTSISLTPKSTGYRKFYGVYNGDDNYLPVTTDTVTVYILNSHEVDISVFLYNLTEESTNTYTVEASTDVLIDNTIKVSGKTIAPGWATLDIYVDGELYGTIDGKTRVHYITKDFTDSTEVYIKFREYYNTTDVYYEKNSQIITINTYALKSNPNFSISGNSEVLLGEDIIISPSIVDDAKGSITYYVNGGEGVVKGLNEDFVYHPSSNVPVTITAIYSGDEVYKNVSSTVKVNVLKPHYTTLDLDITNAVKINDTTYITPLSTVISIGSKMTVSSDSEYVSFTPSWNGIYVLDDGEVIKDSNGNEIILKGANRLSYTMLGEESYSDISLNFAEYKNSTDIFYSSSSNTVRILVIPPIRLTIDNKTEVVVDKGEVSIDTNLAHEDFNNEVLKVYINNDLQSGRPYASEILKYTFNSYGDYVIKANFTSLRTDYGSSFSNELIVHVRANTTLNLVLDSDELIIGEYIKVHPEVKSGDTVLENGKIYYYIGDIKVAEGGANEEVSILTDVVGLMNLYAVYEGYGNYRNSTDSIEFNVKNSQVPVSLSLNLLSSSISVDGNLVGQVILTGPDGVINDIDIVLSINNTIYNVKSGESFQYSINLVGNYTVTASLPSGSDYIGDNVSKNLTVNKLNPTVTIVSIPETIVLGDSLSLTYSVTSGTTGDISVLVDGSPITSTKDDNTLSFTPTSTGSIEVSLKYLGDDKYNEVTSESKTVKVLKDFSFTLNSSNLEVPYGSTFTLSYTLPSDASGSLKLYLNDVEYTGGLDYTVSSMDSLTFKAVYIDGEVYKSSESSITVNIVKASTSLTLNMDNSFKTNEEITVTPEVISNGKTVSTGTIVYYDGDNVKLGEQSANTPFKFTKSSSGDYKIYGVYQENTYYNSSTSILNDYSVGKTQTTLILTLSESTIDVNTPVTISVKVEDDNGEISNGKITLKITGEEDKILNTGDSISFTPIKGGEYNISASFNATESHASSSNIKTLTVNKLNPSLTITSIEDRDVLIGDTVTINTIITSGLEDEVTVLLNNTPVSTSRDGDKFTFTAESLGKWDVKLEYKGGDIYSPLNSTSLTLNVLKDPEFKLTVENTTVQYGETFTLSYVLPSDASGSLKLYLNDVEYTGGLDYTVSSMDSLTFKGVYSDGEVYKSAESSITVNIVKADTIITLSLNEKYNVGDIITVTPTVTSNGNILSTGKVQYYNKNGDLLKEEDINTPYTFTAIYGEYEIYGVYLENTYYKSSTSLNKVYNVSKLKTETIITLPSTNPKVDEEFEILITVKSNENILTEDLTVYINSTPITVKSGTPFKYTLNKGAEYNISVKFEQTSIYEASYDSKILTVEKLTPTVSLTLDKNSIFVDDTVVITPIVSEFTSGDTIEIYLGNTKIASLNNLGAYSYLADTSGNYDITVKYLGNDKYNELSSSPVNLEIKAHLPSSSITLTSINLNELTVRYGDKVNFTAIVSPNDATGDINLYVDGVLHGGVLHPGTDNWMELVFNNVGDSIVTAKYLGSSSYASSMTSTGVLVHVLALNTVTSISLDANSYKYGDTITVTPTVKTSSSNSYYDNNEITTGKVAYYLNNTKIGEEDLGTPFTYTLKESGNLIIRGEYLGDGVYDKSSSSNSNIIVERLNTNVFIQVDKNINVLDTKDIIVTLSSLDTLSESVILSINGTNLTVSSGSSYVFNPTIAGVYKIEAFFKGNNQYKDSYSYVNVVVNKLTSSLTLNDVSSKIFAGDTASISYTITEGVLGNIEFSVNGKANTNISHDEVFNFNPSSAGVYTISAKYLGDDIYAESSSNTITVTVSEYTNVLLSSNTTNPKYGDIIHLSSTLTPTIASGTLELYCNNVKIEDFTGEYDYKVNSMDDLKFQVKFTSSSSIYESNESNILEFSILKADTVTSINLDDTSFTIGDKLNLNAIVKSGDSTLNSGTVEYYIDNVLSKTLDINAPFALDLDTKGDFEVYAKFVSDDKYLESVSNIIKFSVGKIKTTTNIFIDKTLLNIDENTVITVEVLAGLNSVSGKVTLKINDSEELIDINSPYTFTPTKAGIYTVSAIYSDSLGDYASSESIIYNIVVNKLAVSLSLKTNATSIKSGESILIEPVCSINSGIISLFIDGVEVANISSNDTYTYIGSTGGVHNITAKYLENDKYLEANSSNILSFKVLGESTISLTANNKVELEVTVGEKLSFANTINPSTSTGTVKLLLNGTDTGILNFRPGSWVEYTFTSSGDYIFTANYSGNDYLSSSLSNTVIVHVKETKPSLTLTLSETTLSPGANITVTPSLTFNGEAITTGSISYTLGNIDLGTWGADEKFTFQVGSSGTYTLVGILKEDNTIQASAVYTVSQTQGPITPPSPVNTTNITNTTNTTTTINDTNITNNISFEVKLLANDIKFQLEDNKTFTVILIDANNNPIANKIILFTFNGEILTSTTNNLGRATIDLGNLNIGKYQISYLFTGDEIYNQSEGLSNIIVENTIKEIEENITEEPTIKDTHSKIIANDLKAVYGESNNFKGKLQDNEGNVLRGQHISITVTRLSNGLSKTYDVVTDYEGNYNLEINLAPGQYTLVSNYSGVNSTNLYLESARLVKTNLLISRENDSRENIIVNTTDYLSAYPGDGVFNNDFTGTLKDNEGNILSGYHISIRLIRLKADGSYGASKVYDTVCDYRGIFTLQISLAPGEYKAICSYNGNEIYAEGFSDSSLTITRI